MKPKILALTLVSPDLPEIILMRFHKAKEALLEYSKVYFEIDWYEDSRTEPTLPNDLPAISKVARIRNTLIDEKFKDHDYVFWIDSDLVEFPECLLECLHDKVEHTSWIGLAIIAPQNIVELTNRWYDHGAFIQRGTSHVQPLQFGQIYGRNLESNPPYWHPGYELQPLMEMDSVAQCLLVPSQVYREGKASHIACPFYEFFSVCQRAREMGIKTYVDRSLTAFHADRSLYGRNWGTP